MDAMLERLALAPIHDWTLRTLVEAATAQFVVFILVLVRLSGLMAAGPIFGLGIVPSNLRVLLVFCLALLVAPTLHSSGQALFDRLDADRNGLLTRDEIPEPLQRRFESAREAAGKDDAAGISADEFQIAAVRPRTLLDLAWTAASELGLGMILGLGVLALLSGLQLAGDIIDQQTGASLGEIANPGLDITGSVTGHFLFTFATTVLLVMQPSGYHLTMVSAVVQSFQSLPPGEALVTTSCVDLVRDLVHESLVLGVEVAAPLLASMSLIGLTMGFLNHTVPQINVMVMGFPVRAVVGLVVLIASLSGIAKLVINLVPSTINRLMTALTGL